MDGLLAANGNTQPDIFHHTPVSPMNRLDALAMLSPPLRARVGELIGLAKRGLPQMYAGGAFCHTVRLSRSGPQRAVRPEGDSLRYAINVALGLAFIDEAEQKRILDGDTAVDLVHRTAARSEHSDDPGAVALAAWTSAEATGTYAAPLFERLMQVLASPAPVATVDCSWALLAAIAARHLGDTRKLTATARNRLIAAQGPSGLFPHHLPASSGGRLRAHIGCFADQVYSTQGLSRLMIAEGDTEALAAAEACAARICELQGPQGQWWWHYDTRDGSVVEGYPVYSVHQHAMAPMALLDLREAGGTDYMRALARGMRWLDGPNEAGRSMVSGADGVIWRKVARREPAKLVRYVSAATTSIKAGMTLPGLDRMFPPGEVDHECRPYELGWLLYAWLSGGTISGLAHRRAMATS